MKFAEKYATTASRAELICKIDEVRELIKTGLISDPSVVRQARQVIKDLESELVARWEAAVIKRRRLTARRAG